jgi:hypothetical protein
LAVNPIDSYNMVGSSKEFTDPHTYAVSLAAYYTFDGRQSWNESAPLKLLNTGDVDDAGVVWTAPSALPWFLFPMAGARHVPPGVLDESGRSQKHSAPNLVCPCE